MDRRLLSGIAAAAAVLVVAFGGAGLAVRAVGGEADNLSPHWVGRDCCC